MKPLKIEYENMDDEKVVMVVNPASVQKAIQYKDKIRVYIAGYSILVDEPLLDFVARWEAALAYSPPVFIGGWVPK